MSETERKVRVRVTADSVAAMREIDKGMQHLRALLDAATEFTFRPNFGDLNDQFSDDPEHRDAITVAHRGPAERGADPDRWAILHNGAWCWSKAEQCWTYETRPSSRTEDFYAACRFSRDEAVALVPELLREIESQRIPELRRMVEARAQRNNADQTEEQQVRERMADQLRRRADYEAKADVDGHECREARTYAAAARLVEPDTADGEAAT